MDVVLMHHPAVVVPSGVAYGRAPLHSPVIRMTERGAAPPGAGPAFALELGCWNR